MKVLVINPGATSTKISAFDEEKEVMRVSISHSAQELSKFAHIAEQMPYRKKLILDALRENGMKVSDFDAICGRGGLLRHIPSGTYAVNDRVIHDILHPGYGEHAANLGAYIAMELAKPAGIPAYFVDPVCVDEMQDVARISGMKGMERQSFFHALNHKSVARRAAQQMGRSYEELNLIVAHLGGGVSVAAHEKGRVVDVYNVKDDGSMGLDRGGALPVNAVVELCYSGRVYSYLGTKDFREVEKKMNDGDKEATLVFRALAYQLAKDIGSMAAVLRFRVDAIVYTGGMAYSESLCREITSYVSKVAPVICLPGEEEMRSLAEGALRVLHGGKCSEY